MDEENTSRVAGRLSSGFDKLWQTTDDFLREGFGFYILHEGQAASACFAYSACVSTGDVEIAVQTAEHFRGRGLAKDVCSAAIAHCMSCGITPHWSCHIDNAASRRLAQRLGFHTGDAYKLFLPEMR